MSMQLRLNGTVYQMIDLACPQLSSVLAMMPLKPRRLRLIALMILVRATTSVSDVNAQEDESEQDRVCAALGAAHVERAKTELGRDYTNREVRTLYSAALESCVHIETAVIGVDLQIRDLSRSVMRDGSNLHNILVDCSADGANSVILSAVRARFGRVFNVPYREWLDDGFGGPPATLMTPDNPYTRADCERVLEKWLSIIIG